MTAGAEAAGTPETAGAETKAAGTPETAGAPAKAAAAASKSVAGGATRLVRPYRPGDEAGIRDLYRLVFDLDMSPEEWRWYYDGAVIVVAEAEGGRVIGHYAAQPRPFSVDGRRCVAGLVMGSMVAPEFRNIATFVDMAHACYALCRERGIEFVYAFPNDNVWLVRQRMLDWRALPAIAALAASPGELQVEGDLAAVERWMPGQPFPAADWLKACAPEGVRAVHSEEWLTWRLARRPAVEYPLYMVQETSSGALRGYIALKRYQAADGRAFGHIVAWRVRPGDEAAGAALLARAKEHFVAERVDQVSTWLLPASPLYEVGVRAGLSPEKQRKNFGYLALDEKLRASAALDGKWDIGMSDSDVF